MDEISKYEILAILQEVTMVVPTYESKRFFGEHANIGLVIDFTSHLKN